jgi:hypothetical protein
MLQISWPQFQKQHAFWTTENTFYKYLPMAREWLSIPWRVVNILQGCQYTLGFKILCRVVNILPIIPKVGTAISCCQYSLKLSICTHKDVQTLKDCQYFFELSLATFVLIIWDCQYSQGCSNSQGLSILSRVVTLYICYYYLRLALLTRLLKLSRVDKALFFLFICRILRILCSFATTPPPTNTRILLGLSILFSVAKLSSLMLVMLTSTPS